MLQFGCTSDGLNHSQHSKKLPAASSCTETINSIMNQFSLRADTCPGDTATCYDEGNLKCPHIFLIRTKASQISINGAAALCN